MWPLQTTRTLACHAHRAAASATVAHPRLAPPAASSSNVKGWMDSNSHHHHHHCAVRCFATNKFQKNKKGTSSSKSGDSANKSSSSSSPFGFSDADFAAARSKDLDLILAALNAPMRLEPPISEEEKARRHEIGRNYVIGRFKQHNAIHHDLAWYVVATCHTIRIL
jgi:hypothetical protein